MEFKRELLLKAIGRVETVMKRNSTLPIIENVLIAIKDEICTITGTNLESTMSSAFPMSGCKDLAFCVNPKELKDFLNELSFDTIEAELLESKQASGAATEDGTPAEETITSFHVTFGLGSEISFPVYSAKEFPTSPDTGKSIASIKVDFKEFKELINKAKGFVGNDELRPIMSSAKVEVNRTHVRITGTDAHQLLSYTYENESDVETEFTIPMMGFPAIAKLPPKDAIITISEKHVNIKIDTVDLTILQVDGKYPKWRNVVPQDNDYDVILEKGFLEKGMKIVSLSSRDKVVFTFENDILTLSAEDIDFNKKGKFNLTIIEQNDYRKDKSEPFKVAYNPKFFKNVLDAVPEGVDRLKLNMNNTQAMSIGNAEKDLLILMPMML